MRGSREECLRQSEMDQGGIADMTERREETEGTLVGFVKRSLEKMLLNGQRHNSV